MLRPQENTFLRMPKNVIKNSPKLLVVVHSAPEFALERKGIRQSWGSKGRQKKYGFSVVFLLGKSRSRVLEKMVDKEYFKYDDIAVADFFDHYNNLTLKSVFTLKYFLQQNWRVSMLN